jgi:hypothetical protein
MEPIYFPQFNKVLTKPDSMTDDQCGSLPNVGRLSQERKTK